MPEHPSILERLLPFLTFLRVRRLERDASALASVEKERKRAKAEFVKKMKEYRAREPEVVTAYNAAARRYMAKLEQAKQQYTQERAQRQAHNDAVTAFRRRYESGEPGGPELLTGKEDIVGF